MLPLLPLRRADETSKKRGGCKKSKLTEDDVERMLTYVEENPLITLTEIKSKIQNELDIIISTTTIHKYLECRLYSEILQEPCTMNSVSNKEKRRD